MNDKKPLVILSVILAILLVFFFWNKYQIQVEERPQKPFELTPQADKNCGFESCHGLDITCGPNAPQACDTMYQIGDNCRQFVRCLSAEGSCGLEVTPQFTTCKDCVQKCIADYSNDPVGQSTCESTCVDSLIPSE